MEAHMQCKHKTADRRIDTQTHTHTRTLIYILPIECKKQAL